MITITEENYLKNILILSLENRAVTVNALSVSLNIKMPTVNSMMKRLDEKGFVVFAPYKPIQLTEIGKIEALKILRKHRLTETFLSEIMGIGWEDVHPIAEQIEHIQSPQFFDKMDVMLHHPKIDPHGEMIPSKDGKLMLPPYTRLSDHMEGETLRFVAVNDASHDFLIFLNNRDLKLGTEILIKSIESFDSSLTIKYRNRTESLSKIVADKILVE